MDRNADTYEGRDGLTHTYTKIDWEEKTKIGTGKLSPEELNSLKKELDNHTDLRTRAILSLPAVFARGICNDRYDGFTDISGKTFVWREEMLKEACKIDTEMARVLFIHLWRNTMAPEYDTMDMSYEDIISGKWRPFMRKK